MPPFLQMTYVGKDPASRMAFVRDALVCKKCGVVSNLEPGVVVSNLDPGVVVSNLDPGVVVSNLEPGVVVSNLEPGVDVPGSNQPSGVESICKNNK